MAKNYTAVLSIHGIGRHRRHANSGELLSALEDATGTDGTSALNAIIDVTPAIERSRVQELQTDVPMLKLKRARRHQGKLTTASSFRVYEVNWSSDTREPVSLWAMVSWSIFTIRAIYRREPNNWVEWSRLRLARLRLTSSKAQSSADQHATAFLSSAYRKYRGSLGASHRPSKGGKSNIDDFINFANAQASGAVTAARIATWAREWEEARLPCERSLRTAGFTAMLGLALFASTVIAAVAAFFSGPDADVLQIVLASVLALFALIFGRFVGKFMTTVFSDVRYWAALNENDQFYETRNAVLARTTSMIRHMVSDPHCVRVIIVSHSLGTAIAYDALRAIGLHNAARDDTPDDQIEIRKVDCLITLGSPIDKLALLFETAGGRSFREELLGEELRGDLTAGPFWVKGKQRIKWLNFWDSADPVSDPLHTPLGVKPLGSGLLPTAIENIEVTNGKFFDPATSHTTYLKNPIVASRIFNEIFRPETPVGSDSVRHISTRIWSRRWIILCLIGVFILLFSCVAASFNFHFWLAFGFLILGLATAVVGVFGLTLLAVRSS